jgi:uncharacterized iron-regulated protein
VSGRRRFLLLAVAVLAGCAAPAPAPERILEGRIWDARAGRFVDEDELLQRIRSVRYVLLGEVHDNPVHHSLRAALIGRLAPAEVFFEQFDREHDPALRAAQRASADAEGMAKAGALATSWKWPLHKPLVEAALAAGMTVRAANLPGAEAGRSAISFDLYGRNSALGHRLADVDWPEHREAALRAEIRDGHCGALSLRTAHLAALAQRARDAAIASALATAQDGAVLIAGNGHVRRDLGVPLYLPRGATIVSVGLVETQSGQADPRDYVSGANGEPKYDFLWFTAPHPRPDPCETFRKRAPAPPG